MSDQQRAGALLAAHAKRKIARFIAEPDRDSRNPKPHDAFWALLYGKTVVDHATAVAVERELLSTTRTVGDVLEGWRPRALESR